MIKEILLTEWKAFYRNKLQVLFCLLLFLTGLYSIHYGDKEIQRQKEVIAFVKAQEAKQFEDLLKGFSADTTKPAGKKAYRDVADPRFGRIGHKYNAIFHPAPLAGLSLGQRDLFPYYHKLNSHSLYMQIFKNEMVNPQKLLAGNLDLSFVLIFLFPLFIIALGYGLISTEIENGTYPLLKTQPIAFSKIILLKTVFRFLITAALAIVLSIIGFAYAGNVNISTTFLWLLIILLYLALWHCMAFWIASFRRNSAFNAMSLLAIWLLFLIVLPSLTNAIAVYRYPINQTRLSNAIRRIQLNESKEGLYKVVSAYYKQYPQFNDGDTSLQNMYKKGYAMAGQMGDQKAKPQIDQYYHQIKNRDRWASGFNFISPAVQAQQLFNYLSCTDVTNYLNYQREVEDFHRQLVKFYVEPFLLNKQFTFQSYARKPAFQWMPSIDFSRVWSGISLLLLWCIVLFSPAYILLKKNN